MRKSLTTVLMLGLLTLPAMAESGVIGLSGGGQPSVIDSARIQADVANTYAVTIGGNADGVFSLVLQPNERSLHVSLKLLDADQGTVAEASSAEQGKVLRMETTLGPGRYTLEVRDNGGQTRLKPYRLTSSFTPAFDSFEPNNAFETSKPLGLNQAATITLFRFKEQDHDYFTVNHPGGLLNVDISPLKGTHPSVTIFNADRAEVGSVAAANDGALTHYAEDQPAGTYYVRIADAAESNQPKTLQVTVSSK